MQHSDILIFIHKSELSIYTYTEGSYSLCHYKGDETVFIEAYAQKSWVDFWGYVEKEFLQNSWQDTVLSILYHDFALKSCLDAIEYPCGKGLKLLQMQALETALPELLCKMDILKQKSSPVCFGDTYWNVNPHKAHLLSEKSDVSAYNFKQKEIIKAYLGGFPVQSESRGERQMEPASPAGKSNQVLNAFIETSKVEPKSKR